MNKTNKQIITEKETVIKIDEDGNETQEIKETTRKYEKIQEPDYIKLYTNMWCQFNEVPITYTQLFLSLITRMSYCDATDLEHSQLVNTGKPWADAIMRECGWTSSASLKKGLKILCDCNAIKRVSRGVYQINPNYAGKGLWKYNPNLKQGGIADLIATFSFREKKIDTKIVWTADEEYLEDIKNTNGNNTKEYHSAKKDVEQETTVSISKITNKQTK